MEQSHCTSTSSLTGSLPYPTPQQVGWREGGGGGEGFAVDPPCAVTVTIGEGTQP